MTNAFWLVLFIALVAAVGVAGYFIGHERGLDEGRDEVALTDDEVRYFDASIAQLAELGYTWDGSSWAETRADSLGAVNATSTRIPDRTSCEEIEGTPYRSPGEREFYLSTCVNTPITPTPLCGQPENPWCYDLLPGTLITNPPGEFCGYFECAENFWAGTGHVVLCRDGIYSKTGGTRAPCAGNDGVRQPLYSH